MDASPCCHSTEIEVCVPWPGNSTFGLEALCEHSPQWVRRSTRIYLPKQKLFILESTNEVLCIPHECVLSMGNTDMNVWVPQSGACTDHSHWGKQQGIIKGYLLHSISTEPAYLIFEPVVLATAPFLQGWVGTSHQPAEITRHKVSTGEEGRIVMVSGMREGFKSDSVTWQWCDIYELLRTSKL